MGKFSRTQIRTLNSFSPKKKMIFFSFLGGSLYLAHMFYRRFDKTVTKNDQFLDPLGHIFGQILGLFGGARVFFGSNVPGALLIDPRKWLVDAPK